MFYKELDRDIQGLIKRQLRKKESAIISSPVKVRGKIYREVVISKTRLGKKDITGYIYIDEKGNGVGGSNNIEKITSTFYLYGAYFNNDRSSSLIRILKSDTELKKEEHNDEMTGKAIQELIQRGSQSFEIIDDMHKIIEKNKIGTHKIVEKVVAEGEGKLEEDGHITDEFLEQSKGDYQRIVKSNYDIARLITTNEDMIRRVKEEAKRRRRMLSWTFRGWGRGRMLSNLEMVMQRHINMIEAYKPIIGFNDNQYNKHIRNIEKKNIQKRIDQVRSI